MFGYDFSIQRLFVVINKRLAGLCIILNIDGRIDVTVVMSAALRTCPLSGREINVIVDITADMATLGRWLPSIDTLEVGAGSFRFQFKDL